MSLEERRIFMICKKCNKESPVDSKYCPWCGFKQSSPLTRRTRQVGNGSGTAYKRGNTWTIKVIVGWVKGSDGVKRPITKSKGGFRTRKDAMLHAGSLFNNPETKKKDTFAELMDKWSQKHESRVKPKTMRNYQSAYLHFDSIASTRVDRITANMLQECIDNCKAGKRTKETMKLVASTLMKYAMDDDQIMKNPASNLYTGNDPTTTRDPITEKELALIKEHFSDEEYAKYVYALCYLGFRPTEFLTLKKSSYHVDDGIPYVIAGSKTKAGINRTVTIPPAIQNIIDERLAIEGTEYLFPRRVMNRKGEWTGKYAVMTESYFRCNIFKPMMARLGIEGKVPYSARHTYANKIKRAVGAGRDKASLIGHSSYSTTETLYQSTDLEDRKNITDQLK